MMSAYRQVIVTAARATGLDPNLVEAVVWTESGDNPFAWKPEPPYPYFWHVRLRQPFRGVTPAERQAETAPLDFPCLAGSRTQEWWAQQASWGLMQVMGAVAREAGFDGPYLPQLCDPAIGLRYGCQVLAGHLAWAHGNVTQALAAYNGGRGGNSQPPYRTQAYADRVLATFGTVGAVEAPRDV
jgi:hypothetical protein